MAQDYPELQNYHSTQNASPKSGATKTSTTKSGTTKTGETNTDAVHLGVKVSQR